MRSTIITGVFRHRGLVLGAAVVVSIAWFLIWGQAGRRIGGWDLVLWAALLVALVLDAWSGRSRPEAFIVDSGTSAFRTALSAAEVFRAFAGLLFVANLAATEKNAEAGRPVWYAVAVSIWCLGIVVVLTAGRSGDVQLRPAGLVGTRPFGALVVPWEALAPGHPLPVAAKASRLPLTYARPELVRGRGLTFDRRRIYVPHIHPGFLADAIRYYVDHPQHRAAIGTQAEHDRLRHALADRPGSEDET